MSCGRRLHLGILILFLCGTPAVAGMRNADERPNVILIFADDMGYADIGPFGGDSELTPHLNQLASEGRRFTSFYVSQAVCSASRCSLLTGCYNVRVGIQGALGPKSQIGIHADELTLGELFQQKGYRTACFGKWHLGHRQPFLPLQNGFDEYFGLPYSNDMWPYHPEVRHLSPEERLKVWPALPLIEGNTVINPEVSPEDQKFLTKSYTERAVQFVRRNHDSPFFLYVPHNMVHVPLFASPEFEGRSGKGLFSDVLMEVDWSVGQILQAVREIGQEDNTIVIFTSDNGPWLSYGNHAGSAGPFREGKGTMFEGGCRVPCLMKWPGHIPAGSECREPAMTIDLLPTLAKVIGGQLPEHPIDGQDILSLMTGDSTVQTPHEILCFYWGNELQAVRSGKWKLHFAHRYRTLKDREAGKDGIPAKYAEASLPESLFDLEADPGESRDVAGHNPEIVERLKSAAESMRIRLGDGARKGTESRPAGQL